MVWQIARPEDEDFFVLEMTKGRGLAEKPALEYWCESWPIDTTVPVGVIGGNAMLRIRDMMDEANLAGSIARACKLEEAKATIRALLATGSKPSAEMEVALSDAGIKRPTWKRAASAMHKDGELVYDPWRLAESLESLSPEPDSSDSSDSGATVH